MEFHIYNPNRQPIEELPFIFGFNNGGQHGFMDAQLIAEDGTLLGGHCCTSEGFMPYDLCCLANGPTFRHETFSGHYPDGYRTEFVGYYSVANHERLQAAFSKVKQST